jgi:hypothetical protein
MCVSHQEDRKGDKKDFISHVDRRRVSWNILSPTSEVQGLSFGGKGVKPGLASRYPSSGWSYWVCSFIGFSNVRTLGPDVCGLCSVKVDAVFCVCGVFS